MNRIHAPRILFFTVFVLLLILPFSSSYSLNSTTLLDNNAILQTPLAGNVSLIIINENFGHSQKQIDQVTSLIEDNGTLTTGSYPDLNFTIFATDNITEAVEFTNASFRDGNVQHIIHVGFANARRLVPPSIRDEWPVNFTQVVNVGFIDAKSANERRNTTMVDFHDGQAGFLAGIKALDASENGIIGVIQNFPFDAELFGFGQGFERIDEQFISAFIGGVQYANEHLLNKTFDILIKTIAVDQEALENDLSNEVSRILKEFKDELNADTVFNLVRGLDSNVVKTGHDMGLSIGTRGTNETGADFSIIERLDEAFLGLLDFWNNTDTMAIFTDDDTRNDVLRLEYTLADDKAMFLSDYTFKQDNEILLRVQANITLGLISIPINLLRTPQATNFGSLTIIIIAMGTLLYARKKKR